MNDLNWMFKSGRNMFDFHLLIQRKNVINNYERNLGGIPILAPQKVVPAKMGT